MRLNGQQLFPKIVASILLVLITALTTSTLVYWAVSEQDESAQRAQRSTAAESTKAPTAGATEAAAPVPSKLKTFVYKFLPVLILVLFWVVVIVAAVLFIWIFTGPAERKVQWMVGYCYAIAAVVVIFSLTFVFFPIDSEEPPKKSWPEFSGPVGVILGCSDYPRTNAGGEDKVDKQKWVPREIACGNNTTQWLVNFGGKVLHCESGRWPKDGSAGAEPKPCEGTVVRGGLVVPLYFLIVSLFGALVSLTRRVPEFQSRLGANAARRLAPDEAREFLVFQIMQLVSAPLLATAAYYMVDPASRAGSVALAFTAGFSSETILLAIRTLVTKLQPAGAALTAVAVTPQKLDFGERAVGSTSEPQIVTLTNRSDSPVKVTRISTNGDFEVVPPPEGQTVPPPLAAGATHTLNIVFKPTAAGERTGDVTVTDDGVGSPRVIALSGKGTAAGGGPGAGGGPQGTANPAPPPPPPDPNALSHVQAAAGEVDFGSQMLNTSSTRTLQVSNAGPHPLEANVEVGGDFDAAPKGAILLGPDQTIDITFTPTAVGARAGTLTISAPGTTGSIEVRLTGAGADSVD